MSALGTSADELEHEAPEALAGIQDPGKQSRLARGIPVVGVFDGFRAAAITAIVLYHVLQAAGVFGSLGQSPFAALGYGLLQGLTALFVISGFVVYLPTVARGGEFGSLRSYALRRIARIVPAYWVALVFALILLAVVPGAAGLPPAGEVAAHFLFLQTPGLLVDGGLELGFGVIPPVWTLSIEAVFYIVLPLIAGAYFRRPVAGLLAALALLVVWHLVATNFGELAGVVGIDPGPAVETRLASAYASQFPAWGLAFACGMSAAVAYVRLHDRPRPPSPPAVVAVVGAAGVSLLVFVYLSGHRALTDPAALRSLSLPLTVGATGSMAVLFGALAFAPPLLRRPFANRPMRALGDISYGIYLIHYGVIWLLLEQADLPRAGTVAAIVVWFACVYPASAVYGWLSARLVEQPLRRWAQRFGARAQLGVGPRRAGATTHR